MIESGRYFIKDVDFVSGLVNSNHNDFRGVPKLLYREVTVVGYDEGGWVFYKNDKDDKQYTMEEYPFERIYTSINKREK